MAVRFGTRTVGDTVDLRGPRDSTLEVWAPDGMRLWLPAPTGKVTLWLAQAGRWHYAWTDPAGGEGDIDVTAPDPTDHPDDQDATDQPAGGTIEPTPIPAATYRGQPLATRRP